MDNYPNQYFHAEIDSDRRDYHEKHGGKYAELLGYHREHGCFPVPFQQHAEKRGDGDKEKDVLRAVRFFEVGNIVGVREGFVYPLGNFL